MDCIKEKSGEKKKILFFDIDGTLVSFKTHDIPESTVTAIEGAHDNGHKIIISTGRPKSIINNLGALQNRNLIDGYITMNGAFCFVGDDVLYESPINPDDVRKLIEISEQRNIPYIYVTRNGLKACNIDDELRDVFYRFLKVKEIPEGSFEDAVGSRIYQLTIFFDATQESEIKPIANNCEFNRWYPTFVDITAKGVTKAVGVTKIIEYFHSDLSDAVAFGDGGNDIPMLVAAGTGVAMGNADEHVRSKADMVTKSVDDGGIAYALNKLGII